MAPIQNLEAKDKYNAYLGKLRAKLMSLRRLIFETAAEIEDLEFQEETLKWGQPIQKRYDNPRRLNQIKSGEMLYFGSVPNISIGDVQEIRPRKFVL